MATGSRKANNAAEIDRWALAFAKEPGSKAFIPLAEEYSKAGMWEEAAGVLEDGLKTYPGFITAMVALGRAYEQMNQPVKAMAILEEAVKLSPDNLRAHRTLAKLYVAQGAKDAAIRSCNAILALHPQDQEALSLRSGLEVSGEQGSDDKFRQAGISARTYDDQDEHTGPTAMGTAVGQANEANDNSRHLADRKNIDNPLYPTETQGSQTIGRTQVTIRLEQWLNSIQARRRDSPSSSELHSKTSS